MDNRITTSNNNPYKTIIISTNKWGEEEEEEEVEYDTNNQEDTGVKSSNSSNNHHQSYYNQRIEFDGVCCNVDCTKTTNKRYCYDCHKEYQSRKKQCANNECTFLTVARYCRDCRVSYRRNNHYCEVCKDVLTERTWCKECFANFKSCVINGCDKKVQPRFTHCWDHFQKSQAEN